jgi:hypothetical protein
MIAGADTIQLTAAMPSAAIAPLVDGPRNRRAVTSGTEARCAGRWCGLPSINRAHVLSYLFGGCGPCLTGSAAKWSYRGRFGRNGGTVRGSRPNPGLGALDERQ